MLTRVLYTIRQLLCSIGAILPAAAVWIGVRDVGQQRRQFQPSTSSLVEIISWEEIPGDPKAAVLSRYIQLAMALIDPWILSITRDASAQTLSMYRDRCNTVIFTLALYI